MVRADEVHELGQLRIGYGNMRELVGFRFNENKSVDDLLHWLPKVSYDLAHSSISIIVPELTAKLFNHHSERVTRTETKFYALRIPFDIQDETASSSTKPLIHLRHKVTPSRTAKLSIDGWDNCLVLLVGLVHCYLWSSSEEEEFISLNKKLMACDILEVFGVRKGRLIQDKLDHQKDESSLPPADEGAEWE